jgi:hypothetical protein
VGKAVGSDVGKLSDSAVASGRPPKLSDGQGLRLWVSVAGKRTWHLAFTSCGQICEMGLGDYPGVSLAATRRDRDDDRAVLADADPRVSFALE